MDCCDLDLAAHLTNKRSGYIVTHALKRLSNARNCIRTSNGSMSSTVRRRWWRQSTELSREPLTPLWRSTCSLGASPNELLLHFSVFAYYAMYLAPWSARCIRIVAMRSVITSSKPHVSSSIRNTIRNTIQSIALPSSVLCGEVEPAGTSSSPGRLLRFAPDFTPVPNLWPLSRSQSGFFENVLCIAFACLTFTYSNVNHLC